MIDRPTCRNEQIRRLPKVLALVIPMFLPHPGAGTFGQRWAAVVFRGDGRPV